MEYQFLFAESLFFARSLGAGCKEADNFLDSNLKNPQHISQKDGRGWLHGYPFGKLEQELLAFRW